MNSRDVLTKLRQSESALRPRGVRHAALFGSIARGDNRSDSGIDILIEIEPDAVQDVYAYVGLREYIAGLFEGRVDVVSREGLKPYARPSATVDAMYAF
jgi:predicted nucleotidyltransferase